MASGQGGNQRRRRLPSGWEDIPMRNVSPTQHRSDSAQRALFPVPNLNNSPPGILQGSQHSGSISSPNLSPLALSPQAAGPNNSPERNPGAFNGSPPIFAFDVYAPNPVRRPDDVFHPQYSPPARAAIASSTYDTSPNHLSPSTAAGSAGYGTPALGATGSSPYTTTPGSYYSPVEAMRGSGPLDNAGAYGGQYSAVGAIGGQYSAVGAIGGQFPAGSGSRPTRHRRVPSSANLTHLVAGLEQNPGPVHFNFPDVNALANPGLYGGQQLQLSPPSPIQRLNTAQPFVQPMSPLYENQFSPGVRRYSDRSSVGSQIGSAGSLFNNSPLNSPGSGGSNMGLAGSIGGPAGSIGGSAGSIGGPAGSIGGSAGSIGGPAGSIGGSAGSIGGSAGSIGGSAGSFGGSSGMGSMSPIPSFSSGSGRGASSGSEHYEER